MTKQLEKATAKRDGALAAYREALSAKPAMEDAKWRALSESARDPANSDKKAEFDRARRASYGATRKVMSARSKLETANNKLLALKDGGIYAGHEVEWLHGKYPASGGGESERRFIAQRATCPFASENRWFPRREDGDHVTVLSAPWITTQETLFRCACGEFRVDVDADVTAVVFVQTDAERADLERERSLETARKRVDMIKRIVIDRGPLSWMKQWKKTLEQDLAGLTLSDEELDSFFDEFKEFETK